MAQELPAGLIKGADGKARCFWPEDKPDYVIYHDTEWGMPQHDDFRLFEKICLEGFQSGLSWLTILRKRENFRAAFAGFDFHKVAAFREDDVERLVQDAGIIRHRGKIVSTINNAKRAIEMEREEGSLGKWFWSWEEAAQQNRPRVFSQSEMMALGKTEASTALSKELKKRGWSFVGPTTCYAFMQAMGIVNDHLDGCHCRETVEQARAEFERP
ncbi:DNA-3-methyladenine glycosylase I [Pseudahrensia aquimaris]|uniref:DNA-3-methyladenine glycosylase I n=1 Tax=Pseudahrensia aquimaris TaxID=744461 RepID=A0ABW3FCH9_9HYPH